QCECPIGPNLTQAEFVLPMVLNLKKPGARVFACKMLIFLKWRPMQTTFPHIAGQVVPEIRSVPFFFFFYLSKSTKVLHHTNRPLQLAYLAKHPAFQS
ncbi:hypothetical protein, partial [Rhizobium leguminosarum]|uniref:hypothetical protein n=1 Tax=Rhizobium leguminosarum TaxID=384 RepID=UPI003F9ACC4C